MKKIELKLEMSNGQMMSVVGYNTSTKMFICLTEGGTLEEFSPKGRHQPIDRLINECHITFINGYVRRALQEDGVNVTYGMEPVIIGNDKVVIEVLGYVNDKYIVRLPLTDRVSTMSPMEVSNMKLKQSDLV